MNKFSVKEFIEEVKNNNIDIKDFYSKLFLKIKELDKKYNFFITIAEKQALDCVKKIRRNGKLAGLPISVKDCICTNGIQSTAGSKILQGYVPNFDATAVKKIKNESGIIIGKTNQDEFGFGTFCINSGFSIPKNPHDPTRCCGGSSGGAAGLVAALNFPHIALAESTGGSISCPSAWCGVTGLTPTYGLVSRYGLIDYACSLDKIGLIGKKVEDIALGLSVISGYDPLDSTSINKKPENYLQYLSNIKDIKIGIPKEYFDAAEPEIRKLIWLGIKKFEDYGAKYDEVSLQMTKYALSAYYIIACSEASSNLAKFCGMRYGVEEKIEDNYSEYFSKIRTKYFGREAKRRILLGTFARMAGYRDRYYLKAMQVRALVIKEFKQIFKKFDVLIAPTMPNIAPKISDIEKLTPIQQYAMDILTVGPNLAGLPHLSIPCGNLKGMPVGLHIIGDHLQEGKILQVGWNLEKLL
jgi:aspartyl-tRNA(Asn)/glutamyl-tRNA(Gln) amidotransferase subunit A